MKLSVIVPTYNEAPNVGQLIRRTAEACRHIDAEIVFVDDSTDNTPELILHAASRTPVRVRIIHRGAPVGGLSGAVIEGITSSSAEWCVVMDGDLQHPPELIPDLLAELERGGGDIVVASRYCGRGGGAHGLSNWYRRAVSTGATLVTRSLFPGRLRGCSDPMTGFFALRRTSLDCNALQPSGFKILLEILARQRLAVSEIPFVLGKRTAGRSKASMSEGLRFIRQVGELRVGTAGLFAAVGAVGTVLNVIIMAVLLGMGAHYVVAAIVAAELTIVSNFLLQERLVFALIRHKAKAWRTRFIQSFSYNNVDALLRLPVLMLAVEAFMINSVLAQAATLLGAFALRYLYHFKIVYTSRPAAAEKATVPDRIHGALDENVYGGPVP
ncbi:glycosyltransferase [Arthrobacter sp. MDT3-24]